MRYKLQWTNTALSLQLKYRVGIKFQRSFQAASCFICQNLLSSFIRSWQTLFPLPYYFATYPKGCISVLKLLHFGIWQRYSYCLQSSIIFCISTQLKLQHTIFSKLIENSSQDLKLTRKCLEAGGKVKEARLFKKKQIMVCLFRSHTDRVHLVGKLKKEKTMAPLVGHGAQSLGILPQC